MDFDEDDLIQDYIQEEEEEPRDYEYEDDLLAEMEGEMAGAAPSVTKGGEKHVDSAAGVGTGGEEEVCGGGDKDVIMNIPITTDGNEDGMDVEDEEESKGSLPLFVETKPQKFTRDRESHLYGFERFTGRKEWRKRTASPLTTATETTDNMTASAWKKTKNPMDTIQNSSLYKGKGVVNKNSDSVGKLAPEAQLVKFLHSHYNPSNDDRAAMKNRFVYSPKNEKGDDGKDGRESVSVTLSDGNRVYIPLHSSQQHFSAIKENENNDKKGKLLSVSMQELHRRSDRILQKSEKRRKRNRHVHFEEEEEEKKDSSMEDDDNDDASEVSHKSLPKKKIQQQPQRLWVDKHAPTHFSHLLSNERTNREVLRALRQWDPYVFGTPAPPRPTSYYHLQQTNNDASFRSSSPIVPANIEIKTDENGEENRVKDKRPDESSRVILLSGPPGVGKTTLAHIVTKHAGYRPLEVNASDERSASVLTDRVIRAMESTSLNVTKHGKKNKEEENMMGRPNCLILDEIDGADAKSAIQALVTIIRQDLPANSHKKDGGQKRRKKTPYLRRPIIFICNHKHAPALRPLLPFAKIFDVSPPSSTRLVARLKAVLAAENMAVNSNVGMGGGVSGLLQQLVSGAGGDIRSSLYTLQFVSVRAKEMHKEKIRKMEANGIGDGDGRNGRIVDISASLAGALGLGKDGGNGARKGMKDMRNDVSGTILTVFRRLKKQLVGASDGGGLQGRKDVDRVLQMVECFGDNSKTLDCVFTNILNVSYVDPTMDRCYTAHEWLSGADMYRSSNTAVASNNSAENFTMQKFHIPSAAAAIHLLCRVETPNVVASLTYSTKKMIEARYKLEANCGLVNRFVEGLSPKARVGIGGGLNAVVDVVPYGLWLLSAGEGNCSLNRAVSSMEIMSKSEKIAFESHVAIMRALGLTYVKEDEERGETDRNDGLRDEKMMRLEPEIDQVVRFKKSEVPDGQGRKVIPSTLKELLAHGANVERMRERERAAAQTEESVKSGFGGGAKSGIRPFGKENISNESKTNLKQTLKRPLEAPKSSSSMSPKRKKTTVSAHNFLGIGAAKAKAARTARKAKLVGFDRTKKVKLSNSGSGVPMSKVIKFKYQKGFTQAVRVPCLVEDLI